MAKTLLSSEEFERQEYKLLRELNRFQQFHLAGEKTSPRIIRGTTLNRMSKIIAKVAAMGDPRLILDVERHCEQFYLASFAETNQEKQSSIQALQTLSRLKNTLAGPLDPEGYKAALIDSVGAHNMDKVTSIPRDDFHLFVKSQNQKLGKAPGQMATPPERGYFRARKEALKVALKLHEKNCENALDIVRDTPGKDLER